MKSSIYDRDVYDIREISRKGVGCIASQDIEKGTVILREKPQFAVKGGRSEWMKGNWLKDMMNAYMNINQKDSRARHTDELFKLSQNVPPRIKSDRKAEISRAFGSKNKRKHYGSPDKILKIFCIIEANGFSCFKSTYLAIQSAKFNHSCLPNAERTQFRKVN